MGGKPEMSATKLYWAEIYPPVEDTICVGQDLDEAQVKRLSDDWILWTHCVIDGSTFYYVRPGDQSRALAIIDNTIGF